MILLRTCLLTSWLTLLALCGSAVAQQDAAAAGPKLEAATLGSPIPAAPLPEAPEAPETLAPPKLHAEMPAHLPSSSRPVWTVDRSRSGSKVRYYAASVASPRNLAEALLITGTASLPVAPTQPTAPPVVTIASANTYQTAMQAYGDQMDTWRRTSDEMMRYRLHRLEVGISTAETRQLLSNLALPVLLHQEARYRPAAVDASFRERMANAAESVVLTHNDHGRVVPNYSRLVGTVAAGYLGKSLYASMFDAPELNSSHFLTHYVAYSLAGDFATNIAHELVRAAIAPDLEVYQQHGRATEDSYYPLSAGAKVVYWARSTYAARNFIQAALTADLFTIPAQPVSPNPGVINTDQQALAFDLSNAAYGNALQSWRRYLENETRYRGRRFAGGLAASETQETLQNLVVPVVFNMEPRYIPLGSTHDAGARMGHAFSGILSTRTDSGGRTINLPVLVGAVGGALLAKEVYYPALGTPSLASNSMFARTITLNLAADALLNVWSEFGRHRSF